MTARRFVFSNKKLRGVNRRLRALRVWSESFLGWFPSNINKNDDYWSEKIPVILSLVQGKYTNKVIQSTCTQYLINATYKIMKAKPKEYRDTRVTCCIVLPDMFSSEICIFNAEEYFQLHTQEGNSFLGDIPLIKGRSLSADWGIELPEGVLELGVYRLNTDEDGKKYQTEHWYFGELCNK